MGEPSVLARNEGRAGRITLNRPEALHALNQDMCERMIAALREWARTPAVEVIVVDHAEGTRGFCAGGDVLMIAESGRSDSAAAAAFFATEYRLNTLIKEYPKPYVAIIDGVTMGGGVGVSVHGSHRVATERTVFAMPEAAIGLFPDVGGGFFLPRLEGELGMWLALSGERLKGEDVLAAGVATHYAPAEHIPYLTMRLRQDGVSALDDLKRHATGSFEAHRADINAAFSAPSLEEIEAALRQRGEWSAGVAQRMAKNSPLTMKIAMRQLREGGEMSFRDVMTMEYRIATRMARTENFQEGVRAALIDRDNAPSWTPAALSDVTDALVDSFFAPLPEGELTFIEDVQ